MKFEDIPFNETTMPQGRTGDCSNLQTFELSALLRTKVSYGEQDRACMRLRYTVPVAMTQIEMPGITEEGDTVKGFLSESDVESIIKKMHLVSGAEPNTDERHNPNPTVHR